MPGSRAARVAVAVGGAAMCALSFAGCGPARIEAVSIARRSLTNALVAHWSFDEKTGTSVVDHSGNGHHGELTGGTWVEGGRFGRGLQLQLGDSVIIPAFPQATPDWTVSGWIQLSATNRAAFTNDRAVLLTAERGRVGGWEVEFDPRPGFDWLEASYFVASPTNDYVVLDCKCIEIASWLHWTVVFDASNGRFRLYVNGRLIDAAALPAPVAPGNPDLYIGRWYQSGRALSGLIDDYAVWSRALTDDEVAALEDQPVPDPS